MSTIFLGDVHGKWTHMNFKLGAELILNPGVKRVVQLGDFGDGFIGRVDYHHKLPFYWIDGNHDNHEFLSIPQNRVNPNPYVHYMPRGTVEVLGGRTFLFIGGAYSIDLMMRTQGVDWWPEENITYGQIKKILDTVQKADVIVSHDCPNLFQAFPQFKDDPYGNRKLLDILLERYKPDLWFFGHYHIPKSDVYKNTRWTCLGELETVILEDK